MKAGSDEREMYLAPYLDAAAEYGEASAALLWASPKTQRARFEAIRHAIDLEGKSILDAGCGRGDLLDHLLRQGVKPSEYLGIEAVEPLASAAETRGLPACRIVRADFVRDPRALFTGSEIVIFSGSLNTLDDSEFYATLRHAFHAAGEALVFNFLSSDRLAGKAYLFWRDPSDVAEFLNSLGGTVRHSNEYMVGDCTLAVGKARAA